MRGFWDLTGKEERKNLNQFHEHALQSSACFPTFSQEPNSLTQITKEKENLKIHEFLKSFNVPTKD